jgi:hypothetical protein
MQFLNFPKLTSGLLLLCLTAVTSSAQTYEPGMVVAWGDDTCGQTNIPTGLGQVRAIAAGVLHSLALKADGTVAAWGYYGLDATNVPVGLNHVIAISAGGHFSLALKSDGTVVGWGYNFWGPTNVPLGLSGVTSISAGGGHSMALKSDGTIVAWGDNRWGQKDVPAGLSGVRAIAAGYWHSLALKADGTVVAWGDNTHGEATVPNGLGGVVAIAAGSQYSMALKSDGTIVWWGLLAIGLPPLSSPGFVAIAAGTWPAMGLKADGTVVVWGDRTVLPVPDGLDRVCAIGAGWDHCLALTATPPAISKHPQTQTAEVGSSLTLDVTADGSNPMTYQWLFNGSAALCGPSADCHLQLTNLQPELAGAYSAVVTNLGGAVTSSPALLSVVPLVERTAVAEITLSGQVGSSLRLEYTADLALVNWMPLDTVTLASSPQRYFDLSTPLPPQRFYRARQTGAPAVAPSLQLPGFIPALTLTGTVASQIRVDAINVIGPTDSWFTLDTVTLTNTSQLYFDTTAPGQPTRLYRIVPVP